MYHSCHCKLLSLVVVAACIETITAAKQQLDETVVSSRLLLGTYDIGCQSLIGSDSVVATSPGTRLRLSIIQKESTATKR